MSKLAFALLLVMLWVSRASASIVCTITGTAINNADGVSLTVNYPAGTQANDFVLVAIADFANTISAPSGWNQLGTAQADNNNDQLMVFWQIYTSGTSQVFGSSNLRFTAAQVRVCRGVSTSAPIDPGGSAANEYVFSGTTGAGVSSLTLPFDSVANHTGQHSAWPAATNQNNEDLLAVWSMGDSASAITPDASLGNTATYFNHGGTYQFASGDKAIASSGTTPAAISGTFGSAQPFMGAAVILQQAPVSLSGMQIGRR